MIVAVLATVRVVLAEGQTAVSGRVVVLERGDKPAQDVGNAAVWLQPAAASPPVRPVQAQVVTANKEFRPRVTVVPVGSTVSFPNSDAFDHNVFSLSEEAQFDLGLYGRGQVKSHTFARPGVARVYCNVHAQMSAFVIVRDAPWYTQPAADGSFAIPAVPPGDYVLHAWHERAAPFAPQPLRVGPGGAQRLEVRLDARGYKFVQHLNKFGQPYARGGRRY
ncbi:MAG TPA: carboxypeptidase regulatory-like domain-containing protein [Gemmatimonadales bacterium]|nr:carboxypeptidase regulatory-like domain-containing protein [Gemmatimonadales bacterium]